MSLSSAKTTLIYVNAKGQTASHDYGDLDLSQGENFNLAFDLSSATLTDGCRGIISMTNNNWSSKLTITFGDVYLAGASAPYSATLSGSFVADDSYVLDYLSDPACTSIDMTKVTALPDALPWTPGNRVTYLPAGNTTGTNLVVDGECQSLVLTADGSDFRPVNAFNAQQASLTLNVNGCRMVAVPFDAAIPEGVKAYAIDADLNLSQLTSIAAHTPCLLEAQGEVTLTGAGTVAYKTSALDATFRATYTAAPLFAGDYVLTQQEGRWGFRRLTVPNTLQPFDAYAQLSSIAAFLPVQGDILGIADISSHPSSAKNVVYDLQGRQVSRQSSSPILQKGLYIVNGKKVIIK
jgi:glucuronoarabinoxylan endo-1,4-beta-xylanase